MVAEKFQIYSVKTAFVSQKIESVQFYACLQAKLSPRLFFYFYYYPAGILK